MKITFSLNAVHLKQSYDSTCVYNTCNDNEYKGPSINSFIDTQEDVDIWEKTYIAYEQCNSKYLSAMQ